MLSQTQMWSRCTMPPGLCLALAVCMLLLPSAVAVCPAEGRCAQIEFDHTNTITFLYKRMERFLRCLCNTDNERCQHQYNRVVDNTQTSYLMAAFYPIEVEAQDERYVRGGQDLICHPGQFGDGDNVTCVRVANARQVCLFEGLCHPYNVSLKGEAYNGSFCDINCLNLWWVEVDNITSQYFTGYPRFEPGTCDTGGPDQTTMSTVPATTAQAPGQQGCIANDDDDDDETWMIVAIVGWAVAAAILAAFAVHIILHRRRLGSKRDPGEGGAQFQPPTVPAPPRLVPGPGKGSDIDYDHTTRGVDTGPEPYHDYLVADTDDPPRDAKRDTLYVNEGVEGDDGEDIYQNDAPARPALRHQQQQQDAESDSDIYQNQ